VKLLGLTQKPSQTLIPPWPLRPLWLVFRCLCVSPIIVKLSTVGHIITSGAIRAKKGIYGNYHKLRKKALEQVAINSLREGLSVEVVARITGLTIERVQQLQAELQVENK
jgi:hypothetical protein